MEILVFKTGIKYVKQINSIKSELDKLGNWNFDLEDCDNIFRIEAEGCEGKLIEQLFNQQSIACEELH